MASFVDTISDSKAPVRLTRRSLVLGTVGLVAGAVATAGLEAVPAAAQTPVIISSPHFVLQVNGKTVATFTQLKGISTEVDTSEFVFTNPDGSTFRTKLFGSSRPPEVVLAGPGRSKKLRNWFLQARASSSPATRDMTLLIENADHQVLISYTLENAWVAKFNVNSLRAGSTEKFEETVTIRCDEIIPNQPTS